MKKSTIVYLSVIAVVATCTRGSFVLADASGPYRVINLGVFEDGQGSLGFGLNNEGRPVGAAVNSASLWRGFYWDGFLNPLAPLDGDSLSHAFDINDAGEVVAMSFDMGELNPRGLLWYDGAATQVGALTARGINNAGVVTGYISSSTTNIGHTEHAAAWNDGTITDLGTLGGNFSYAVDVSGSGRHVGWSTVAGDQAIRATIWHSGAAHDLGTLGGSTSQAYAISENSQYVAGVANTAAGEPHAFLFGLSAGGAVQSRTDLGVLSGGSSYAYGVNNFGEVVGTSNARAFKWQGGTMVDLNTLAPNTGWILETAQAINDGGQVVGTGIRDGMSRAYLLARTGDFDADGDVDLADYARFAVCLGGPGVTTVPTGCSLYDFAMSDMDEDSDADLDDFAALQAAFDVP